MEVAFKASQFYSEFNLFTIVRAGMRGLWPFVRQNAYRDYTPPFAQLYLECITLWVCGLGLPNFGDDRRSGGRFGARKGG